MGYDFHITRAASWPDSDEYPINQIEWENLADSMEDLVEDGYVDWTDIGRQRIYTARGGHASFSWRHGRVVISGYMSDRDEEVAAKVTEKLGASLFGDDE